MRTSPLARTWLLAVVLAGGCHEHFDPPAAPDLYKTPIDFGFDLSTAEQIPGLDLSAAVDLASEHDLAVQLDLAVHIDLASADR